MPPVPLLAVFGVAAVRRPLVASQVLSLLARDAVDLFASPLASRIRVCAASDCGLLYLDQSRSGTRSAARCGAAEPGPRSGRIVSAVAPTDDGG